jgi:hypothetical protein
VINFSEIIRIIDMCGKYGEKVGILKNFVENVKENLLTEFLNSKIKTLKTF